MGKICTTPNCGKKVISRGWCVKCYSYQRYHKTFTSYSPTKIFKHRLVNIQVSTKTAYCAVCGLTPIHQRSDRPAGESQGWRCGTLGRINGKMKGKRDKAKRRAMLSKACEICSATSDLVWDHNHETNKFRGTLCQFCLSCESKKIR